jgi:hypothetical protein
VVVRFYQICDTFDFQPSVSEPTVRYDLNFCGGFQRVTAEHVYIYNIGQSVSQESKPGPGLI